MDTTSEIKGGGVGVGHLQTVFEHEFGQSVHWVLREGVEQLGYAFRKDGDQIDIQVFPEGQRLLVEDFSLFILLVLLLHHVVLVLDITSNLLLFVQLLPALLPLAPLVRQMLLDYCSFPDLLDAEGFDE